MQDQRVVVRAAVEHGASDEDRATQSRVRLDGVVARKTIDRDRARAVNDVIVVGDRAGDVLAVGHVDGAEGQATEHVARVHRSGVGEDPDAQVVVVQRTVVVQVDPQDVLVHLVDDFDDAVAVVHTGRGVGVVHGIAAERDGPAIQARQRRVNANIAEVDDVMSCTGARLEVGDGVDVGQQPRAVGAAGVHEDVGRAVGTTTTEQVSTSAADDDVAASTAVDGVVAADCGVDVVASDLVAARASVDAVCTAGTKDDVVACARADRVVAQAAVDAVGTRAGGDAVVAVAAKHGVVAVASVDHVIARASSDAVSATGGGDDVIARAGVDGVVGRIPRQVVQATVDGVVACARGDAVGACATGDVEGARRHAAGVDVERTFEGVELALVVQA